MTKIYEQHDAAFANVSAYVILKDGKMVAKIAFKFPKDGAGRLWCYVHWIGSEMVRGYAGGYGYDKRGAAVECAIHKLNKSIFHLGPETNNQKFYKALCSIGGHTWDRSLQDAGFTVLQAV